MIYFNPEIGRITQRCLPRYPHHEFVILDQSYPANLNQKYQFVIDGGNIQEDGRWRINWQIKWIEVNQAKEIKRNELKTKRESIISENINNMRVDRLEDRESIAGTIENWGMLGLTDSIQWVMADNSIQALSKDDLISVKTAYIVRKAQAFAIYDQLVLQLTAAQTTQDVIAIQWPES